MINDIARLKPCALRRHSILLRLPQREVEAADRQLRLQLDRQAPRIVGNPECEVASDRPVLVVVQRQPDPPRADIPDSGFHTLLRSDVELTLIVETDNA